MREFEIEQLRANSRFLIQELQGRGVELELLDYQQETYLAQYRGRTELLVDLDGSAMPYSAEASANHKWIAKRLLARAGLAVPKGERFFPNQANEAVLYAKQLGFPVVVKPCVGSGGVGVELDLDSLNEVDQALDRLFRRYVPAPHFIVEEQFAGREYRVFITRSGAYASLARDPASVIGDGERSIEALVFAESYRRTHPRVSSAGAIPLDEATRRYLARHGRSLATVPARGEKVYLRKNSNVSTGATCEDVTEATHPSVIERCRRALAAVPGLPYVGVDFMTADIAAPQTDDSYRIIELNTNPGIGMHAAPSVGRGRDVAGWIADLIFPETRASAAERTGAIAPLPSTAPRAGALPTERSA